MVPGSPSNNISLLSSLLSRMRSVLGDVVVVKLCLSLRSTTEPPPSDVVADDDDDADAVDDPGDEPDDDVADAVDDVVLSCSSLPGSPSSPDCQSARPVPAARQRKRRRLARTIQTVLLLVCWRGS